MLSLKTARSQRIWQHEEWLKLCKKRFWTRITIEATYCRTCTLQLSACNNCPYKFEIKSFLCPACQVFDFCQNCPVAGDCKPHYFPPPNEGIFND